jgi:hypothetical protein
MRFPNLGLALVLTAVGCSRAPVAACNDPEVRQEVLVGASEAVLNYAVSPAGFEARLDTEEEWFSIGLAEGPLRLSEDSLILNLRGQETAYVLRDVRAGDETPEEGASCSALLHAGDSEVPLVYTITPGPRGARVIRGEANFQNTLLSFRGR